MSSKLSVASPTSQLILQPFPRFTYVTTYSPTLPLLHLRHSTFSNPSFATPTSQDFHLRHLASRPCQISLPYAHYSPHCATMSRVTLIITTRYIFLFNFLSLFIYFSIPTFPFRRKDIFKMHCNLIFSPKFPYLS